MLRLAYPTTAARTLSAEALAYTRVELMARWRGASRTSSIWAALGCGSALGLLAGITRSRCHFGEHGKHRGEFRLHLSLGLNPETIARPHLAK